MFYNVCLKLGQVFNSFPGMDLDAVAVPLDSLRLYESVEDMFAKGISEHLVLFQFTYSLFQVFRQTFYSQLCPLGRGHFINIAVALLGRQDLIFYPVQARFKA